MSLSQKIGIAQHSARQLAGKFQVPNDQIPKLVRLLADKSQMPNINDQNFLQKKPELKSLQSRALSVARRK